MSARLDAALAELVEALKAELAETRPDPGAPERLLSVDEAARALGIGRSALYNGPIARGELRTVKVGRRRLVPASAIATYISEAES